jgi:hypothetical protein
MKQPLKVPFAVSMIENGFKAVQENDLVSRFDIIGLEKKANTAYANEVLKKHSDKFDKVEFTGTDVVYDGENFRNAIKCFKGNNFNYIEGHMCQFLAPEYDLYVRKPIPESAIEKIQQAMEFGCTLDKFYILFAKCYTLDIPLNIVMYRYNDNNVFEIDSFE